jgi:hypothetical protein
MSDDYKETMQRLAGAWRLVASEFRTSGGDVMYPLGEDALGQAIFTETGYMSGQLMRANRPKFAADNQALGTQEEIQQAFQGYVAYYGRCDVDVAQKTITTHVEGSMYPNWVGGEQIRFFELTGDRLVLRTPTINLGEEKVIGVLTWQRL